MTIAIDERFEDNFWDLSVAAGFTPGEMLKITSELPRRKKWQNKEITMFLVDYGKAISQFLDFACVKYPYLDKKEQFKAYWTSPFCSREEFSAARI